MAKIQLVISMNYIGTRDLCSTVDNALSGRAEAHA